MKKLRWIGITIIVIIILLFISLTVSGACFSQKGVLAKAEKELHYGPSDKILFKAEDKSGSGFVISDCGGNGLSYIETRRKGFLYFMDEEEEDISYLDCQNGYLECDKIVNIFSDKEHDMIFGRAFVEGIKPVHIYLLDDIGEVAGELTIPTDENGFFIQTGLTEALGQGDDPDWSWSDKFYGEISMDTPNDLVTYNSEMVKGLEAGNYPVANTDYPVDWQFLLDAPEGDLPSGIINKLNMIMQSVVRDGSLTDTNPNMMFCFFSYGDGPDISYDLKMSDILKYFPREREIEPDEAIRLGIENSEQWNEVFPPGEDGKVWTFDNVPTPIHVISGKTVRNALKYYTDLEITEIRNNDACYVEMYDVYWTYTSDFGPPEFRATSGYKEGDYVILESRWRAGNVATMHLKEKDGRYIIEKMIAFRNEND